jgi:hypothetical protein
MEAALGALGAGATPEATAFAFAAAVAARDPATASSLFSNQGMLLTPDGTEVRGRAPLREILAQMAMTQPLVRFEPGRTLATEGQAIVSQTWTISSKGAGEERFEQSLSPIFALARGERGWLLLAAAPWGM